MFFLIFLIQTQANPLDGLSPVLSLNYSIAKNQSQVLLQFSSPLDITAQVMQQLIAIELVNIPWDYQFTVNQLSPWVYAINLQFNEQFYFTKCTIRFVAPYQIRSDTIYLNGAYQTLNLNLGPYVFYDDQAQAAMLAIEMLIYSLFGLAFLMMVSFKIFVYYKFTFSFDIGTTVNLFWLLIDSAQLANVLMYFNTQITPQVRDFLRFLRYFNFTFSINNIFYTSNETSDKQILVNENIIQHQYIYNTFVQWSLIFAMLLITLISKFIKNENLKAFIEFSFILRAVSLTLCSLLLFGYIQIDLLNFDGNVSIANTTATIVGFIFIFFYFLSCFIILNRTKGSTKSQTYSVLFEGLQTKAFFKRNFYLFLEFRKLVFTTTVITLYDQQNTCVSLLVITQIITVTIMATKFPFRVRAVNLVVLWTEIFFTFAVIMIAIIVILDYISESYLQTSTRNIDGWCIIAAIMVVFLGRGIFIALEAYSLVTQNYRSNQKAVTFLKASTGEKALEKIPAEEQDS